MIDGNYSIECRVIFLCYKTLDIKGVTHNTLLLNFVMHNIIINFIAV